MKHRGEYGLTTSLLFCLAVALVLSLPFMPPANVTTASVTADQSHTVTVQGDSLSVGMKPYFGKTVSYSSQIGRHVFEGIELLRHQRLGHVVIFALGTNDYLEFSSTFMSQLKTVRSIIGPHRCLVVPSIYAFGSIDHLNKPLNDYARHHKRFFVPPWAREVRRGHVILADGVHPARSGGWKTRARLIRNEIKRCP